MATRNIIASDLKYYSPAQAVQQSSERIYAPKEIELHLAGQDYCLQLKLCPRMLHFESTHPKIQLSLQTLAGQPFVLGFSLDALNSALDYLAMPQVITGVNEEFLTSLMELFTAGLLEPALSERLTLVEVSIVKDFSPQDDQRLAKQASSYQLMDQANLVFTFVLLSLNDEILRPYKPVDALINIDVPGRLGFAHTFLALEDIPKLEPGDLLPMQLLKTCIVYATQAGPSFSYSSDNDYTELSDRESHQLVYKTYTTSLAGIFRQTLSHSSTAKPLFFYTENALVIGFSLVTQKQLFFSIYEIRAL